MSEASDNQLVQRILAGETDAETQLLHRFSARIARKVSYHLGPGNPDLKDVTADIQLAVLMSLRDGKFDINRGSSISSYVYGVTANKIRDYFKSQKKSPFATDSLPENIVTVNEAYDVEQKEIRAMLNEILGKLKIKYKEVLYLRYYKEMSIEEISRRIGLPPRRVSERIHYALKLIRKRCEKEKVFSILFSLFLIYI